MEIIRQRDGNYAVQSESGPQMYTVSATGCTCPHHQYRGVECKHMVALKAHIEAQTALGRAADKAAHLTEQELLRALSMHKGDAAQAACLLELACRQLSQPKPEPRPIPAGVLVLLEGATEAERERALAVYR